MDDRWGSRSRADSVRCRKAYESKSNKNIFVAITKKTRKKPLKAVFEWFVMISSG